MNQLELRHRNPRLDLLEEWGFFPREFSEAFREVDRYLNRQQPEQTLMPQVDVEETDKEFLLSFDLPGIKRDEIEINVDGNKLHVTAERKRLKDLKEGRSHRIERTYGKYARSFTLPEQVNGDDIQASYEDGVLYVSVPKVEVAAPRKVKIESGKSGFLRRVLGEKKEEAKASNS